MTATTPPTIVYYPAHERPLTEEQIEAEFAKLGRNDGLRLALMQVLQERLVDATVDAAHREENAPGRIEEILGLTSRLASYRKGREARKV